MLCCNQSFITLTTITHLPFIFSRLFWADIDHREAFRVNHKEDKFRQFFSQEEDTRQEEDFYDVTLVSDGFNA